MAFGASAQQKVTSEESEAIRSTISFVEKLKSETAVLRERLTDSDRANALKDGELSAMSRALEHERRMRTFYQTFAVRVSMRLSTIMDESCTALQEAQDAANHESEVNRGHGADIPPIEIPKFMKRWQEENEEQRA